MPRQPNRKDIALLRSLLADGKTPDEIADITKWSAIKIKEVQEVIFEEEEKALVGRRTSDVYVDYVLRTRRNIEQLDNLIEEFRGIRHGTALVGAVKAKQDLLDKIVDRGQQFGFIDKRADRYEHALLVANLSDIQLKRVLADELSKVQQLVAKEGNRSFDDIIEAEEIEALPPRKATIAPKIVASTKNRTRFSGNRNIK